MTVTEVKKLFLIINNCYQNFEFDDTKISVWHKLLENYPYSRAERHLMKHVKKNKFIPTPADIIVKNYLQDSIELIKLKDQKEQLKLKNTPDNVKQQLEMIEEEIVYLDSVCNASKDRPINYLERMFGIEED